MRPESGGELFQGDGPTLGDKVFFVRSGVRHWVINAAWLAENGFVWPDDVKKVPEAQLLALTPGRPIASAPAHPTGENPDISGQLELRALGCSLLKGEGIEFGAGANPLPISLDAKVSYADPFTYEELLQNAYPGQSSHDMIRPTIQLGIDQIDEVLGDYDFIACSHVIEHVVDPIRCIVRASQKLRPEGCLLLFVPDMRETFDRTRKLTSLPHLIADFFVPSHERDREHHMEFYREAFPLNPIEYESAWRRSWDGRSPIHYHTWTYESFEDMVKWLISNFQAYTSYISHKTVGNEFFFLLKK